MKVIGDTWTGNLKYSNQLVSMGYERWESERCGREERRENEL
jgi:hypothetical protein